MGVWAHAVPELTELLVITLQRRFEKRMGIRVHVVHVFCHSRGRGGLCLLIDLLHKVIPTTQILTIWLHDAEVSFGEPPQRA